MIVLVGANLATAIPVALPKTAFRRLTDNAAHSDAHLTGAACHAAVPQLVCTGPQVIGDPDTNHFQAHPVLVLPPQWSEAVVRGNPASRCALPPFHPTFIAPGMADPDANTRGRALFVRQWWQQACTYDAGRNSFVRINPSLLAMPGTSCC